MFWAKQLNDSSEWNKFATALLYSLNVDYGQDINWFPTSKRSVASFFLAIKVFREIGHPGMVMALEEIKVKSRRIFIAVVRRSTILSYSSMWKIRISSRLILLHSLENMTLLKNSSSSAVVPWKL